MRKFLVFVVVLAVLGVAADFLAGRAFETRTRQVVQQRFDLQREPVVQVRDFPFLLSVARGRLDTVDVAATDVDAGEFTLDRLQLTLQDVEFSRDLLVGRPGTVTVRRATGQVRITQDEVNRLIATQLDGASIAIGKDGVTVSLRIETPLFAEPLPVRVLGILTVRGGRIIFLPQRAQAAGVDIPDQLVEQLNQRVAYQLPPFPGGLVPDRVSNEPGALVIGGHVEPFTVRAR
jgi:hypothetical protein